MPSVSGRLVFNSKRMPITPSALPGIAGVPIVLQNTNSGAMLAVLTNANGNYSFTNVPGGNYQIVEYYGMTPVTATPGDFANAVAGTILAGGVVPPISYAPSADVPAGATNLDCFTPNTLLVTVLDSNLTGQHIINGPVKYKPISTIIDSNAVVSSDNILDEADDGTFGAWPPGTHADTGLLANPYPGVGKGFTYVHASAPVDGQFTIMNINNNGAQRFSVWWRFADHTTGNETGRMMVINGYHPGASIYEENVIVKPDTYYLFSTWILNMLKSVTGAIPALGVRILDSNEQVLVDQTLGQFVHANPNTPEWVEAGSVIYSGSNTALTVIFVSQGPRDTGNDYVIDDIALYEVTMPDLIPVKTSGDTSADVGETVMYTVKLSNTYDRAITNVKFEDTVPDGLTFVPGSVKVNGVSQSAADPDTGFALPDVLGGETVTVTFSAKVDHIPQVNPALNAANMAYDYTIVEGGIPSHHETVSNEVSLEIGESADVSVLKKPDLRAVKPGNTLTYTITVTNNGPSPADNVILTDTVPTELLNAEYSVNGGAAWQPLGGSLGFGTMESGTARQVLIRGTADPDAVNPLVNTAEVSGATYDPDLTNNTSTTKTNIFGPRCQAIADVIESVAMQETALSHILNAEGGKIQAMLEIDGVTAEQLLTLNNSATRLIGAVTRLEMMLQAKLNLFSDGAC